MHHVVFPAAFVVAAIVENVFAFAVLESVLLLSDELVPVRILLVNVFDFFVLNFYCADARGEDPTP